LEPLEEEELLFLQQRSDKESKEFMFAMNVLLKAAVIIPLIAAIFYYVRFESTKMMFQAFLYALAITTILITIAGISSYFRSLHALRKDLKEKNKTIESALITEKKYMALNNTWHFYTTSPVKYSIEVSEDDYHRFEVNDEINLEYGRHSLEYFGYH
jgi:hypothetical protein